MSIIDLGIQYYERYPKDKAHNKARQLVREKQVPKPAFGLPTLGWPKPAFGLPTLGWPKPAFGLPTLGRLSLCSEAACHCRA